MACKRCEQRGKTWNGSDPKCAFPDGHRFNSENWNCATMNALREIGEEFFEHRDDSQNGSICIVPVPEHDEHAGYLVLTYYKNRGCTGMVTRVCEDYPPTIPGLRYIEEILDTYDNLNEYD